MEGKPGVRAHDGVRQMFCGEGVLDVVLDTDAFNEVDDQFALCYSLLSPERIHIEAVYAAPFLNERADTPADGMEKSYEEILHVMSLFSNTNPPVYRGSQRFMRDAQDVVPSDAADDLVRRARIHSADKPLYVIAIGAITNVASALRMAPDILDRIAIVWLGGHALHWPHTREFNLMEDMHAARTVLDSGVPLLLVPCQGVSSHMLVSVYELRACIGGANVLCDTLVEIVAAYTKDCFAWTKALWDVAAIAAVLDSAYVKTSWVSCPDIDADCCWVPGREGRHEICVVDSLDRNRIFRDLFMKLRNA